MDEIVRVKIPSASGQVEVEAPVEVARKTLREIARRSRQLQGRPFRLKDVILQLIEEGFFDSERTLSDIKKGLLLRGMDLETTSISPILWRDFVSKGIIQRVGRRRSYKYFVGTE